MPTYDYACDGCEHSFEVVKKMKDGPRQESCPVCGEEARKVFHPPYINGRESLTIDCRRSVGRTFTSVKELERFAEKNNLTPMSSESREWKSFKQSVKEDNSKDAMKRGFDTLQEEARHRRKNKRDSVAEARQKRIDAHHATHGNANKQTVDKAFGPLPEKT